MTIRSYRGAACAVSDEIRGLWFGLPGVVIFAMTLPMTRLAAIIAAVFLGKRMPVDRSSSPTPLRDFPR